MAECVWGHSSSIGSNNYVIFCVGFDLIKVAAFRSWMKAKGIHYKSLRGSYKKQIEDSFIVAQRDYPKVRHWARDQDSILLLGPCDPRDRRPARLLFNDGHEDDLGLFRSCDKATALKQDSWTYDPTTGHYYICEPAE